MMALKEVEAKIVEMFSQFVFLLLNVPIFYQEPLCYSSIKAIFSFIVVFMISILLFLSPWFISKNDMIMQNFEPEKDMWKGKYRSTDNKK